MDKGEDGKPVARIGVIHKPSGKMPDFDAVRRYGPIDAIPTAFVETWHKAARHRRFHGPHADRQCIAEERFRARHHRPRGQCDGETGAAWFLNFLALLSVSAGDPQPAAHPASWMGVTCCITLLNWSKAAR